MEILCTNGYSQAKLPIEFPHHSSEPKAVTKEDIFILSLDSLYVMMNHFMYQHLPKCFLSPINIVGYPYLALAVLIGVATKGIQLDIVAVTKGQYTIEVQLIVLLIQVLYD